MALQHADERRRRRTSDRAIATGHLLTSVRHQHEFDLLVLCDADGLILASSGDAEPGEALAAYAPLLRRTPLGRARASILATLGALIPGATADGLHVREIAVDNTTLLLCAAGTRNSRTEAGLFRAQQGIQRIFA